MPLLGPVGQAFGLAQAAHIDGIGLLHFGRGEAAHEQGLLAEDGLDRLTRFDRTDVDFGAAFGEHIFRRSHLAQQR